jgi:uncharacterized protein
MRGLAVLVLIVACKSSESPPRAPAESSAAAPHVIPGADPWADNGPIELPPPRVTRPFRKPFFWSATKDGKTTYLFGTVHGGVDAEKRIPLWVWKHFDAATTLIEEANIQDVEIMRWTVRPDGPTLRDELGDEYWAKLERVIGKIPAGLLDTQATPVAALRVSGFGGGARDAAGPMDGELLVRAQGLKKKIVFLETPQFHSKLFTELHDLASLRILLDRYTELEPLNRGFYEAYVDGDAERIDGLARQQFRIGMANDEAYARLIERLLTARNRAWIPQIEEAHADGGVFVAVGALHLVGKDSLVDMLRERGFTVEREQSPQ